MSKGPQYANPAARAQLQSREHQGQESQLQNTQTGEPGSSGARPRAPHCPEYVGGKPSQMFRGLGYDKISL